ncbi:diaminobutyrate acetyltransferase [Paralcaligenes sp. KSB-10]|uniref:diaminobutyrate acetyltransferase n=1 Tax=Paralcaligenes sp. KSB-10 TaxID=2901142 RepID=UPI001E3E143C|nr:diaminobutyrate acetyltransferase [Paralcaligenes sp. KSB-10]UHL64527.1 diaminobutyrate acetyltransferase [Paralcaligenes sp. KSB-10]
MELRPLSKVDGLAVHRLVGECPPLDLNSVYVYLLLSEHFSDTCVLAENAGVVNGFISAYMPPARPEVLFVWQVAVHSRARGHGLARLMLWNLLERPGLSGIRYIETTVGPDNAASRNVFAGIARQLRAPVVDSPLFERELFGAGEHADERLLRIGPFDASPRQAQAGGHFTKEAPGL